MNIDKEQKRKDLKEEAKVSIEKIFNDFNSDEILFKEFILYVKSNFYNKCFVNFCKSKFYHECIKNKKNELMFSKLKEEINYFDFANYVELAIKYNNVDFIKQLLTKTSNCLIKVTSKKKILDVEKFIVRKISKFDIEDIDSILPLINKKNIIFLNLLYNFIKNKDFDKIDYLKKLNVNIYDYFHINQNRGDLVCIIRSNVEEDDYIFIFKKIIDVNPLYIKILNDFSIRELFVENNNIKCKQLFNFLNEFNLSKEDILFPMYNFVDRIKNSGEFLNYFFENIDIEKFKSKFYYNKDKENFQNIYNVHFKNKILNILNEEIEISKDIKKRKI